MWDLLFGSVSVLHVGLGTLLSPDQPHHHPIPLGFLAKAHPVCTSQMLPVQPCPESRSSAGPCSGCGQLHAVPLMQHGCLLQHIELVSPPAVSFLLTASAWMWCLGFTCADLTPQHSPAPSSATSVPSTFCRSPCPLPLLSFLRASTTGRCHSGRPTLLTGAVSLPTARAVLPLWASSPFWGVVEGPNDA